MHILIVIYCSAVFWCLMSLSGLYFIFSVVPAETHTHQHSPLIINRCFGAPGHHGTPQINIRLKKWIELTLDLCFTTVFRKCIHSLILLLWPVGPFGGSLGVWVIRFCLWPQKVLCRSCWRHFFLSPTRLQHLVISPGSKACPHNPKRMTGRVKQAPSYTPV